MDTIVVILILLAFAGICLASIVFFRRYDPSLPIRAACGRADRLGQLAGADRIRIIVGLAFMPLTDRRAALQEAAKVFVEDEVPEAI